MIIKLMKNDDNDQKHQWMLRACIDFQHFLSTSFNLVNSQLSFPQKLIEQQQPLETEATKKLFLLGNFYHALSRDIRDIRKRDSSSGGGEDMTTATWRQRALTVSFAMLCSKRMFRKFRAQPSWNENYANVVVLLRFSFRNTFLIFGFRHFPQWLVRASPAFRLLLILCVTYLRNRIGEAAKNKEEEVSRKL